MSEKRIIVIGGGPAGMMAAIRAGQLGADVTLLEKNAYLGKKLLLSGKGRCNLTNACPLELFLKRFGKNGQFLRDAFKKFFHPQLINFFAQRGLKLKIERQQRVFPVTDKAASVRDILLKELQQQKTSILYQTKAQDIILAGQKIKGVELAEGKIFSGESIILATGGISYSFTGSAGEGLEMAKNLGHRIIPLRPGLVALETKEKYPRALQGLTLKHIRTKFKAAQKEIISEVGELLFTDSGISGPLVLSLSGQIVDWLAENKKVSLKVDLKPALSTEQLDARLLREFSANPCKNVRNILNNLLPKSLVAIFLELARINPINQASQITQKERLIIVSLLKALPLEITRSRPIKEAMVTRGGVSLKEINPRTMESRLIKGLYFAGELIDLDADTGGFNLQAAFSTGYLAGESAALS